MLAEIKGGLVPGNKEVVELLEQWLDVARAGEACYVALAMIKSPNLMIVDFVGTIEMENAIEYALDQVKERIKDARAKRTMPPRDPNLTADYVCYNMSAYPMSFDFIPWLIDCEMTRIREGAPAPLKIYFYKGQSDNWERTEYRRVMMDGVVQPALKLIGAVEDPKAELGRSRDWFCYKYITQAAKKGEMPPLLKPTPEDAAKVKSWLDGKQAPVVITLRETDHWPHRNSNSAAWLQFGKSLEERGARVIFVRDTCRAEEPLPGFETCPEASKDLGVRMALYEQARCNLFVPNGPWCLALFGTRPWLCFNEIVEGDLFLPNTPGWWLSAQGIDEGEQFPWSKPDQRIIWKRDDLNNIIEAWNDLWPLLKAA